MAVEALSFKIGADAKAFRSGIKGAMGSIAGMAAAFISVRAVISSFSDALDMGGRLNDLASSTGDTAGNLAILERSFQNAGAGAENVGPAIAKMQKSIQDASEGTAEAVDALALMGLTAADLEGKLPTEQVQIMSAGIAAIDDPTKRAAAAMGVFGKSGSKLLPLLRDFDEQIRRSKDQLGSLPDVLDKSNQEFDDFGDGFAAIKSKGTEFSVGLLSEVLPSLNKLVDTFVNLDAAGSGSAFGKSLVKYIESLDAFVASINEVGAADTLVTAFNGMVPAIDGVNTSVEETKISFLRMFAAIPGFAPSISLFNKFMGATDDLADAAANAVPPVEDLVTATGDVDPEPAAKTAEEMEAIKEAADEAAAAIKGVSQATSELDSAQTRLAAAKLDAATAEIALLLESGRLTEKQAADANFGFEKAHREIKIQKEKLEVLDDIDATRKLANDAEKAGNDEAVKSYNEKIAKLKEVLSTLDQLNDEQNKAASSGLAEGDAARANDARRAAEAAGKEIADKFISDSGTGESSSDISDSKSDQPSIRRQPRKDKITNSGKSARQKQIDADRDIPMADRTKGGTLREELDARMDAMKGESEKKKQAEKEIEGESKQGKGPDSKKPEAQSMESIVTAIKAILEKIEPKLPQQVMA